MTRQVVLQELARGWTVFVPEGDRRSFGRDAGHNDVECADKHVSRHHCVMHGLSEGRVRIEDRSTYGTRVEDAPVDGDTVARPGDRVVLGYDFGFRVVGVLDPDATRGAGVEPKPPAWLGEGYLLVREVGRGGMGIVFEAVDRGRGAPCAVKWLQLSSGDEAEELTRRFEREARAQAILRDYPGIATVFDQGRVADTGELYYAMELVTGESLQARLKAGIERHEGVRWVARVARAVEYAHERGILHRDLKPANVLVTEQGAVRLTDFGIARVLSEETRITATGIALGTPGYMAPEQTTDTKRAGTASDVYGLGAILYRVLTGKVPAKGKGLKAALRSVQKGTWDPPRAVDPSIDAGLEQICLDALRPKAEERTSSAGALAAALEEWLRRHASAEVKLQPPKSPS